MKGTGSQRGEVTTCPTSEGQDLKPEGSILEAVHLTYLYASSPSKIFNQLLALSVTSLGFAVCKMGNAVTYLKKIVMKIKRIPAKDLTVFVYKGSYFYSVMQYL